MTTKWCKTPTETTKQQYIDLDIKKSTMENDQNANKESQKDHRDAEYV